MATIVPNLGSLHRVNLYRFLPRVAATPLLSRIS